jgi:hypothetical protein
MPLFYFDFWYKDDRALTDEGMWFPDLGMAEREAREIAAQIASKLGVKRVGVCIRDHDMRVQREIVVSGETRPSGTREWR